DVASPYGDEQVAGRLREEAHQELEAARGRVQDRLDGAEAALPGDVGGGKPRLRVPALDRREDGHVGAGISVHRAEHQGVATGASVEEIAAVAALPGADVVARVADLDVAVRLRAALDATDQDVVAGSTEEGVAAEHPDQDVVAAASDQQVGVVQALVGGDPLGLELSIVLVVVVAADQDLGAVASDELRGREGRSVQGQAEGQAGGDANLAVHCRLPSGCGRAHSASMDPTTRDTEVGFDGSAGQGCGRTASARPPTSAPSAPRSRIGA